MLRLAHNAVDNTPMLQDLYLKPLKDLGDVLARDYSGIFSPEYSEAELARYLAKQFTTDCAHYVEHCEQSAFTGKLLQRCFERIGLTHDRSAIRHILDIGSGSGNSIFPLLAEFPGQRVIASDLSPHMLLALRQGLQDKNLLDRCDLLQLNAEQLDFRDGSMDLVVGIAVLHHLIRPDLTIAGTARILKPGGIAIFSEPFENGNYLLCMAFREMLAHPRTTDIPDATKRLLNERIAFVDSRKGFERTLEQITGLDDKWLFTRQFFEKLAREHRFSDVQIMPLSQTADYLQRRTRAMLKLHTLPQDSLPEWAWAILARFENGMSSILRQEMPVEAAIIFRK